MKLSKAILVVCLISILIVTNINLLNSHKVSFAISESVAKPAATTVTDSTIIVVEVTDQYGNWYNGVHVNIWQQPGSLQYSGTIQNGFYSSGNLASNQYYTVIVSSGYQTVNQTVFLANQNLFLAFNLTRPTPSNPDLVVSNVSLDPSIVPPGTSFYVKIDVNNVGSEVAYASSIAISTSNSPISIIGSTNQISMGVIQPGQNLTVEFHLTSSVNAQTGTVPVSFKIVFQNNEGISYNATGSFNVVLTATPNLQVGDFTLSNVPLAPGSSSILTLSVDNVGGDSAYSVALTLSGHQFLTGNSSNYLGLISSGGSSKTSFYISIANNTKPGAYSFSVDLTYKDISGRTFNTLNNFSVQVEPYPPPAVTITNILVDPPVLSPGTSGSITLFLKNSGLSDASNVLVRISGASGIVSTSYFGLGTISAGSQVTQVIGVNVLSKLPAGNYSVIFNVNYTDQTGRVYHSSVPMEISIYSGTNIFSTRTLAIIGGVVVVAVLGIAMLRRTKLV